MLQRAVAVFVLFFIILITPSGTYAFGADIDISRTIPGINCGMPGVESNPDAAQCCYYAPIKSIDKVPWLLEKIADFTIPGLFPNPLKAWNNARESLLNTQEKYASKKPCFAGFPKPNGISPSDPSCRCEIPPDGVRENLIALCRDRFDPDKRGKGVVLPDGEVERLNNERDECVRCGSDNGYYSAIGCVRFSLTDFITRWVFGFGVSLAGLFALGCIIVAALRIQLSQGQSETVQQSREMMTSCILGLLLIIFSVFLLNVVGITILPGLFF
jgi:ribosomal protein S14